MFIVTASFLKISVFEVFFSFTLKRKAGVSKFLRFAEGFRKAPFSRRISVDVTPNRRNKTAFSNFFGLIVDGDLERLL